MHKQSAQLDASPVSGKAEDLAPGNEPGRTVNDFDPDDEAGLEDPDHVYARLREECPVAHSSKYGGFWAVTRYIDVQHVMSDTGRFSSSQGIIIPRNPASGRRPPLHFDPPEHTTYRTAMNAVFRKDRLRRLDPLILELAERLLPPVGIGEVVDLYTGYCSVYTARVVCALLNIPDELVDPLVSHMEIFEEAQRHRRTDVIESENVVLYELCRRVVADRRAVPMPPTEDLVSALLRATIDGEPMDPEVVTGSLRQIIVAGHGAPALALSSAVLHLARDKSLQDGLRAEPGLVPGFVEEMLRLHTPNVGFARTAVQDSEVGGRLIRTGEPVAVVLPSANRDMTVFADANQLRLDRGERHLAFGYGPHVCPGSVTGRLELAVALRALLSRTSDVRVAGPVVFSPWPTAGPVRLPLELR